MNPSMIALFGEAGKGDFNTPYFCHSLPDLVDSLGHPPRDSRGLHCAVRALLFHRDLIFLRVREEGFSLDDYLEGVKVITSDALISKIAAIYMPGVGSPSILDVFVPLCQRHHHLLIMDEIDFYDYLLT